MIIIAIQCARDDRQPRIRVDRRVTTQHTGAPEIGTRCGVRHRSALHRELAGRADRDVPGQGGSNDFFGPPREYGLRLSGES